MYQFFYVGVGAMFLGWIMNACWIIVGERIGVTTRKKYLQSLLNQEIGWFDQTNQAELAATFSTDCFTFQNAIGQNVSTVFMAIGMFIGGFTIAFIKGWLMTLVVAYTLPVLGITGYLFLKFVGDKDKVSQQNYMEAGGRV